MAGPPDEGAGAEGDESACAESNPYAETDMSGGAGRQPAGQAADYPDDRRDEPGRHGILKLPPGEDIIIRFPGLKVLCQEAQPPLGLRCFPSNLLNVVPWL